MAQSALDETRRSNGANRRQSRAPSEPNYPTSDQSNSALLQSYGSDPIGTGNRQLSRPERERARGGAANSTPASATPLFNQPKPGQGQMGSGRSQRSAISAGNTPAQFTPIPNNVMRAEVDRYERVTGNSYQPDAQPVFPTSQPPTALGFTPTPQPSGPSMTQDQFAALLNPQRLPQSAIGAGVTGSTPGAPSPASTPPPPASAPDANARSAGGGTIYSGMVNGVPTFSDNQFAGSQPYGGQPRVSGDTDAIWSRMAGTPASAASALASTTSNKTDWPTQQAAMQEMRVNRQVAEEQARLAEALQQHLAGRLPLTRTQLQIIEGRMGELNRFSSNRMSLDAGLEQQGMQDAAALSRQQLSNEGALANTELSGQYNLQSAQAAQNSPINQARTAAIQQALTTNELGPLEVPSQLLSLAYGPDETISGPSPRQSQARAQVNEIERGNQYMNVLLAQNPNFNAVYEQLLAELDVPDPYNMSEEEIAAVRADPRRALAGAALKSMAYRSTPAQVPRVGFAEGGLVGGMLPSTEYDFAPELGSPPGMDMTAIQNYQKYVDMANQMGLDPVPFEQFSQMASPQVMQGSTPGMPEMQPDAQASQQVFGMADGGMVPGMGALQSMMGGPQVDGKLVTDPNPAAPTDSIPAVIDGQQPAALDSGEFVIPKDVVMYYGTEKLSKLIEKARNPAGQQGSQGMQDV